MELNGNFCLKHLWDADQIRKFPAKEAVVVGSGLIGLEVVAALKKRGQSVTLIENQDRLGPRIFDHPVAEYLKKILEGKGIRIYIKESVRQILEKGHVKILKTTKHTLSTDLIIWATGMQPESKLAKQIGLRVGDQGGVIVQETMETSLSGIFAAGDVTEFPDPLLARPRLNLFWYVGAAQGRVAGLNSVGIRSELFPFLQMGTARILETTLAFIGYTGEELLQKGLSPDTKTIITRQGLIHQVFLDGRLVGLQMVNPTRQELLMANHVLRTQRKYSPIP